MKYFLSFLFGIAASAAHATTAEVNPCDAYAASAADQYRVAAGVAFADIDTEKAIDACRDAVTAFPNMPRFQYQYGRALARRGYELESASLSQWYRDASDWYRRSARLSYPAGQYALGLAYATGQGMQQNMVKAVWWWRKAADQYLPDAQFNIGAMYEQGQGVLANQVEAYFWYGQVVRNEKAAQILQDKANERIVFLGEALGPEEVTELEQRIENWVPGFNPDHLRQLARTNSCVDCKLQRADLRHLDLKGADLRGADLELAQMRGMNLARANLSGANLYDSHLEGANLIEVDMSGANIGKATLVYANMRRANLRDAYGIDTRFVQADLGQADLRGVRFEISHFGNAKFRRANLQGAVFVKSNFGGTDFRRADLTGADLTESHFTAADLRRSDLQDANMTDTLLPRSDLTGANLAGARYDGADFRDARLTGIQGLTQTEIAALPKHPPPPPPKINTP